MKIKEICIVCVLVLSSLVMNAQNDLHYSMSFGSGLFVNTEDLGEEVGVGNNPRLSGAHYGVGNFFEFLYLLPSHYWIGFKYMNCDLLYPNNDHGEICWATNKMIRFDSYSLVFKKSFIKDKNTFDFSGGILFHDYSGTNFSYDGYQLEEIDGVEVSVVNNLSVDTYHSFDVGMFLAAEYKYRIADHLNIGVKSEIYGLLNIGTQAVTLMPIVEMRF